MQKRVLLFDQDQDYALALASRLKELGVEPFVVTDRDQAVARLTWDHCDLVCVDVDMQTGRGLAFCEYLTWNIDTRNVPVIVLTSRSQPADILRCCDFRPHFVRKSSNCWRDLESLVHRFWPQLASV